VTTTVLIGDGVVDATLATGVARGVALTETATAAIKVIAEDDFMFVFWQFRSSGLAFYTRSESEENGILLINDK
jgi:hypothetical protein